MLLFWRFTVEEEKLDLSPESNNSWYGIKLLYSGDYNEKKATNKKEIFYQPIHAINRAAQEACGVVTSCTLHDRPRYSSYK